MLRNYFRLVLKDGTTLTQGDDWPEPDIDVRRAVGWLKANGYPDAADALGRAARLSADPVRGKIFMIVHQPEVVENISDDDDNYSRQAQPERYLLLMRANIDGGPQGLRNPKACPECDGKGCAACPQETQIMEVLVPDVKYAQRLHGWNDATTIIKALFDEMNDDLIDPASEEADELEDDEEEAENKPNGKEKEAQTST